MKLYTAKVAFDFVLVANDPISAFDVALAHMREAFGDIYRHDVGLDIETGVHAYKWDDECIPYGGDGNTRTGEYLSIKGDA